VLFVGPSLGRYQYAGARTLYAGLKKVYTRASHPTTSVKVQRVFHRGALATSLTNSWEILRLRRELGGVWAMFGCSLLGTVPGAATVDLLTERTPAPAILAKAPTI
jgi:hypothetical protein